MHPSTRLPGTFGIEAEIAHRLEAGVAFGVCYADLDHFKEFNDRYGYYEGDRIIREGYEDKAEGREWARELARDRAA